MLVIRFQRVGKKKQASFRIVLQERSWKPQGKIKELLGFYSPHSKEKKFQAERIKYWLGKGAQPSPTIQNLFVDAGIVEGPKVKAWKPKKKTKETQAPVKAEVITEGEKTTETETKPAASEGSEPRPDESGREPASEPEPEPTKREEPIPTPAPADQKI